MENNKIIFLFSAIFFFKQTKVFSLKKKFCIKWTFCFETIGKQTSDDMSLNITKKTYILFNNIIHTEWIKKKLVKCFIGQPLNIKTAVEQPILKLGLPNFR